MMLRAVMAFLALPALVAGVFPWLISRIPAPVLFRSFYGTALLAVGSGILLSAVISFYRRGRGTLAPWDPPKHLVVQDLYRFTRNPMYVGVVALACGWALVTGNPWNYVYAVVVPVIFHLRVVFYEEEQMERLFGREWTAYRQAVPRWGLVWRPYTPNVEPDVSASRRPLLGGAGAECGKPLDGRELESASEAGFTAPCQRNTNPLDEGTSAIRGGGTTG
jgi:protein-S-isoprenylcysteine O-methyltransferase Ste14